MLHLGCWFGQVVEGARPKRSAGVLSIITLRQIHTGCLVSEEAPICRIIEKQILKVSVKKRTTLTGSFSGVQGQISRMYPCLKVAGLKTK